jgi:RNA polymerase sigma-70 factor (ECF subfamily)
MAFDRRQAIQNHAAQLYGYAVSLCADPTLAEDLAQETITKAMSARRVPRDPPAFRAWMFRILRNTFIDHTRRTGRLVALDADDIDDYIDHGNGAVPHSFEDGLVNALTIRFALEKLKPGQREIIGLVDIAGFSYAEAAELLEVPAGTIMSRLSRARKQLADAIVDTNIVPMPRRIGRSL